jgi:hypothetical protein
MAKRGFGRVIKGDGMNEMSGGVMLQLRGRSWSR